MQMFLSWVCHRRLVRQSSGVDSHKSSLSLQTVAFLRSRQMINNLTAY